MALTFEHAGETLSVEFTTYPNSGNTAVLLKEASGAPYAHLTINVDWDAKGNDIYVRNYNGEGPVLQSMIDAGILSTKGKTFPINDWGAQGQVFTILKRENDPVPAPVTPAEIVVGSDDDTGRDFDLSKLPIESLRIMRNWLNAHAGTAQKAAEETTALYDLDQSNEREEFYDTGLANGKVDAIDTMYTEVLKAIDTVNAAKMTDIGNEG